MTDRARRFPAFPTQPGLAGRLLLVGLTVAGGLAGLGILAQATAAARPTDSAPTNGALALSDGGAGGRDLYTVQPDGTGRAPLVSIPVGREAQPTWSPDGRFVAFSTELPGDMWAIGHVEAANGNIRLVTNGPGDLEPDWRRDGQLIAFSSFYPAVTQVERSTIAVVRPDGTGIRPLVQLISTSSVITSPSWSPDGTRLVFVLRSNAEGGELYVTDAAGRNTRRLLAHSGWDDIDPAWSPDGRRIAFSAGPHRPGQSAEDVTHGIWLYDVQTGDVGAVYTDPSLDLRRPAWSPDGAQLALDGHEPAGRVYGLYTAAAVGGVLVGPITTGAEPAWGPGVPPPTPGPSPTEATPEPTTGFPTTTPPPGPGGTDEPTLEPFPTIPTPEPSPTGPPPTFPRPTDTPTPTATASPSPSPSPTPPASPTPTMGPRLYLPWLAGSAVPE